MCLFLLHCYYSCLYHSVCFDYFYLLATLLSICLSPPTSHAFFVNFSTEHHLKVPYKDTAASKKCQVWFFSVSYLFAVNMIDLGSAAAFPRIVFHSWICYYTRHAYSTFLYFPLMNHPLKNPVWFSVVLLAFQVTRCKSICSKLEWIHAD